METSEELGEMTVSELKQFLERQEVSLSDVGSSGRTPRPLKRDLLEKALQIRRSYELERTPDRKKALPLRDVNVFQRSAEKESGGERAVVVAAGMVSSGRSGEEKVEMFTTPVRRNRRQSYVDSGLFGDLDETSHKKEGVKEETMPLSDEVQTRSKTRRSDPVLEIDLTPSPLPEEEIGSGSAEEFVSDWSDGGEIFDAAEVDFARLRVVELKEYLEMNHIPFESKARKPELIALAKANHALLLSERKGSMRRKSGTPQHAPFSRNIPTPLHCHALPLYARSVPLWTVFSFHLHALSSRFHRPSVRTPRASLFHSLSFPVVSLSHFPPVFPFFWLLY